MTVTVFQIDNGVVDYWGTFDDSLEAYLSFVGLVDVLECGDVYAFYDGVVHPDVERLDDIVAAEIAEMLVVRLERFGIDQGVNCLEFRVHDCEYEGGQLARLERY